MSNCNDYTPVTVEDSHRRPVYFELWRTTPEGHNRLIAIRRPGETEWTAVPDWVQQVEWEDAPEA